MALNSSLLSISEICFQTLCNRAYKAESEGNGHKMAPAMPLSLMSCKESVNQTEA